jgi:hypothetical protein
MLKIQLLPGEHLQASVARLHYLTGLGSLDNTTNKIFIKGKQIERPFPALSLQDMHLAKWYNKDGYFAVLKDHSFANYVCTYLNNDASILTGVGAEPKLIGTHSLLPRTWRWCICCAEEDDETCGVPYYHRDHQLPGVFHCDKHKIGLISGCSECGFKVDNLKRQLVPSIDNYCPNCGVWMSAFDGYFDELMARIESKSLQLVRQKLVTSKYEESTQLIREYIGLNGDGNTVEENKKICSWKSNFQYYLGKEVVESYFANTKQTQKGFTASLLGNARIYSTASHLPPLPPLPHLLALDFIENN